jgi:hypothetical protein
MTRFLFALSIILVCSSAAVAQQKVEKTTETRVEIDSSTGQRRVVSSETVHTTEDITTRNSMLVINPLKFFLYYNLSYYQRLSNTLVVGGGLQMPTISEIGGFGANAEIRLHPSGKAMRGFYVAPNVSFNVLSTDFRTDYNPETDQYETREESASAFSVGGLVGWQWFPGDDFAMGLGIGLDYYFLSSSVDDELGSNPFSSYNGTAPAFRFDIGYAW